MHTWRIWELALPALERRHDVLAPTLAGHVGGPPLEGDVGAGTLADHVEQAMDEAGFRTAHIAGNSLGGLVALQLAARGRARSVTALAPAGGWARGDDSYRRLLRELGSMQEQLRAAAPNAEALVATDGGRRLATRIMTERYEHIPRELIVDVLVGMAGCRSAPALIEYALREGYDLDAERIDCPLRIVWGSADRLLDWPSAAARFREDWVPQADWVLLDDVGHCPQLDVPLEAAQLILGVTAS